MLLTPCCRQTDNACRTAYLSFFHTYNEYLQVGILASKDLASKGSHRRQSTLTVGAQCSPLTDVRVKVKFSTDHEFGVAYFHQLSKYSQLVLHATVNTVYPNRETNKFGLSLILTD
eukprot:TRINITY_DN22771_c0_g1_i1.p1 TRINITY_DN22771_c0_g1~~TRINITY_DN22771_c0_g1_i1.p1  ORF type:complete len:116 (-),score=3.28 TRINITY_DN22771_c0_g1_i1:106-453(-)